jgi:hypothetical protein
MWGEASVATSVMALTLSVGWVVTLVVVVLALLVAWAPLLAPPWADALGTLLVVVLGSEATLAVLVVLDRQLAPLWDPSSATL